MSQTNTFDIIVVGAGPGGAMAAYLLAKKGMRVLLVEKERHSRKVARGEFIQPPSIELLEQLGFLDDLLQAGLQKIRYLEIRDGKRTFMSQDYEQLRGSARFVLTGHHHVLRDLLRLRFQELPHAELWMGTSVRGLLRDENGNVCGIHCEREGIRQKVRAKLVIACDGRGSAIRTELAPRFTLQQDYPTDLCVFEVPKPKKGWPAVSAVHFHAQPYPIAVQPLDPEKLRVAFYIPKGTFKQVRDAGVEPILQQVVSLFPGLAECVQRIRSWEDCGLSTFSFSNYHVEQYAWDGVVLLGDSAHAVSPLVGMGQQMALLDAQALIPHVETALARGDFSRASFLAYEQERLKQNQALIDFDLQSNQLNFIHKPFVVRLHHRMLTRMTRIPSLMQRGLELGAGYPVEALTRKQKWQAMGLLPTWL